MPLAHAFAINMASELRHAYFPGFSSRASSALLRHQWPGNVRELKNAVERSVYRSATPETPITKIAFDPFDSPFKLAEPEPGKTQSATSVPPPLLPADLPARLTDLETELIEAALERSRFNQKVAASMLGLSYHQFRGRLRKLNISGSPSAV